MDQSHSLRSRGRPLLALLLAGTILIAAGVSVASCSASDTNGESTSAGAGVGKRTSDAGSVTVDLSWDGGDSGLVFKVTMDTHSVDLDGFDLKELAVLRTDQGVEVVPTGWDAPKGNHHREGTLSFPATVEGRPVLSEATRGMTVIVRDVASPERSYQWTW